MNRKPSYDHDISLSNSLNQSEKDYSDIYPYKKYNKYFDKFNSQVIDRNASKSTHYTTNNYDFSTIRKLP